ncbi:MAG: peptidase domain-containing ABC transporter [Alphaproteobacteria bacterium]|nr:MAG: peptidase domain-containing ABC transporter [Alphaproteobacteria bacterium]
MESPQPLLSHHVDPPLKEPPATGATDGTLRGRLLRCLRAAFEGMGKPVSESDLQISGPSLSETPGLAEMALISRRLGYRARVTPFDPGHLDRLPCPFVLLTRDGKTCLTVLRADNDRVLVHDPATSRTEDTSARDLPQGKADILLLKTGGEEVSWREMLWRQIRGVMRPIIASSVAINIFALLLPLVSIIVFNKVIGNRALSTLDVLAIGASVAYIFDTALRALRGYLSVHTGARLDAQIGSQAVAHLLRLPLTYFENTPTGLQSERLRQLDFIRTFLTGQMPMVVVDLVFGIVLFAALLAIDVRLGAVVLGSVPIFLLLSVWADRSQRALSNKTFAAQAARGSSLNEILHNAHTVKALALESDMETRHGERLARSAQAGFEASHHSNMVLALSNGLMMFISLLVLYLGARFASDNTLTLGELVAFNMLTVRALTPIRQVVTTWHSLRETQMAFRRIDELMNEEQEPGIAQMGSYPRLRGTLRADNLGYTYPGTTRPALRGVNFALPTGTMTGIIGPSGCGKSTLAKIILGLYPPGEGRVLVDAFDLRQISPFTLRREIGYVPQDNHLFAGSVRENIVMGAPDTSPARAMMAAQYVGAHDFIQRLPQGYDTILTEGGFGLSAGQRQLLCVARALAREPRILILDEATSALDVQTEDRLLRALRQATKPVGLTVLFITHRLPTLRICDQIVMLRDGMVERAGPADHILNALMAPPPSAAPTESPLPASDKNGGAA